VAFETLIEVEDALAAFRMADSMFRRLNSTTRPSLLMTFSIIL